MKHKNVYFYKNLINTRHRFFNMISNKNTIYSNLTTINVQCHYYAVNR